MMKWSIILVIVIVLSIIIIYHTRYENFMTDSSIHVDELNSTAQTGDLIFTRWNYFTQGSIPEYLIKNVLWTLVYSMFTHVGMIMRLNGINYVYSSSPEILADCYTKKEKDGTSLIPLADYIKKYNGRIAVKRCKTNVHEGPFISMIHKLKDINYDFSTLSKINCLLKFDKRNLSIDEGKLICTHVIGACLQKMGVNVGNLRTCGISEIEKATDTSGLYEGLKLVTV